MSWFDGWPGGIPGSFCPPVCQRRAKWSLLWAGFPVNSELSLAGVLMEARCWHSSGDRGVNESMENLSLIIAQGNGKSVVNHARALLTGPFLCLSTTVCGT